MPETTNTTTILDVACGDLHDAEPYEILNFAHTCTKHPEAHVDFCEDEEGLLWFVLWSGQRPPTEQELSAHMA